MPSWEAGNACEVPVKSLVNVWNCIEVLGKSLGAFGKPLELQLRIALGAVWLLLGIAFGVGHELHWNCLESCIGVCLETHWNHMASAEECLGIGLSYG